MQNKTYREIENIAEFLQSKYPIEAFDSISRNLKEFGIKA